MTDRATHEQRITAAASEIASKFCCGGARGCVHAPEQSIILPILREHFPDPQTREQRCTFQFDARHGIMEGSVCGLPLDKPIHRKWDGDSREGAIDMTLTTVTIDREWIEGALQHWGDDDCERCAVIRDALSAALRPACRSSAEPEGRMMNADAKYTPEQIQCKSCGLVIHQGVSATAIRSCPRCCGSSFRWPPIEVAAQTDQKKEGSR
jgi:hypothetical protein